MISSIIAARVAIEASLTLLLCLLALFKGGGPEKAIASTLTGMWLLDGITHQLATALAWPVIISSGHLLIDFTASVAFVLIALTANRVYPIWIAGLQLISTAAHLVRVLYPAISQSALAILMIVPSYFEILAFGIGTLRHLQRLKVMGPYRSWDSS